MQIKKTVSIILLLVMIFSLSGCREKFSSSLNTPDKINIYTEGKQKQITKNGDEFEQILFDRITELVNIKVPKDWSAIKSTISDNDLKEVKAHAVEFIYNKPQSTTINYGKKEKIEFTEVVFPLSEKWENTAFIKKEDNTYVPVGVRENLDYLVKDSID